MKLSKLDILAIPNQKSIGFNGLKNFKITGVSIDSRTIKKGELFIAIRGEQFDGHNFISKAIEAGAAGIVVERRWADANVTMMVSTYIPRLIVENTIHAFGHLANIYRRKFDIPFIAVGGSNGKTTTKEMIKNVLNTKYCVLCTEGNLNNHIGVPQTLFRLEKKHEVAIVEIGTNHPSEIRYLCSILEPTYGLITNIGREHLEFFGSVEGVARAEGELFNWLTEHHGICFVNTDDKYLARLSKKLKKKTHFGFTTRNASVKGTLISIDSNGQVLLRIKPRGKKPLDVKMNIPGEHNAKNALAAATVGFAMKVPLSGIQKGLASLNSVSTRIQIQRVAGITILNDTYNANPDSMLAALATLRTINSTGKKIAILADMLELGIQSENLHRQIGNAVSEYGIDILLTFGSLSKSMCDAASVESKAHYDNKTILSEHLIHTLADGDVVLIKGSRGMKMEEIVTALVERLSPNARV